MRAARHLRCRQHNPCEHGISLAAGAAAVENAVDCRHAEVLGGPEDLEKGIVGHLIRPIHPNTLSPQSLNP